MQATGYLIEKQYGSVWEFTPTKLDVTRRICFHDPHPSTPLQDDETARQTVSQSIRLGRGGVCAGVEALQVSGFTELLTYYSWLVVVPEGTTRPLNDSKNAPRSVSTFRSSCFALSIGLLVPESPSHFASFVLFVSVSFTVENLLFCDRTKPDLTRRSVVRLSTSLRGITTIVA